MTSARRPRHPGSAGEAGFGLIEVIVAAAIFAVLALGVLAGVDGAAGSAGREKARAVAISLAERDQERMHSMRAVDLPEYRNTSYPDVGGVTYTVVSEADWVSDATGSTVSCQSNGGRADYLRLRSTVTSATVGKRTSPVVLDSIVAPPIGSAGGNNGTLAVKVTDRDSLGVQGISVGIAGTVAGHTASATTNAIGCAIFANIPADTYDVSMSRAGWVTPEGVEAVTASGVVSVGNTTITPIVYDAKGTLAATFSTRYYDPVATLAWKTAASQAWRLTVANDDIKIGGGQRTFPASATAPQSSITATNLFPFKDGYGVYSGACTEENPSQFDGAWSVVNAFKFVDRGFTYSMDVRQPALPVRVAKGTNGGSGANKDKPKWVGGANVQAKLAGLTSSSVCASSPDTIKSIAQDATNGLQSYPLDVTTTNGATRNWSGTSANNYDDGFSGFVTRKAPAISGNDWGQGHFDPGLPWGKWQICADDGLRRNFRVIDNTKPDGSSTYQVLDLNGTGSEAKVCTASGWPAA